MKTCVFPFKKVIEAIFFPLEKGVRGIGVKLRRIVLP